MADEPSPDVTPSASRPDMPGYGLADATAGGGLLPWSWAVERLMVNRNYWVATTRPDGRPHLMPVWGVWLDGAVLFSTGAASRKARNLGANATCVVSTEDAVDSVIVEGESVRIEDLALLHRFAATYTAKYDWPTFVREEDATARDGTGTGGPVFAVRPHTVFGFTQDFTGTATRWRFEA